jgi:hypothetical protein
MKVLIARTHTHRGEPRRPFTGGRRTSSAPSEGSSIVCCAPSAEDEGEGGDCLVALVAGPHQRRGVDRGTCRVDGRVVAGSSVVMTAAGPRRRLACWWPPCVAVDVRRPDGRPPHQAAVRARINRRRAHCHLTPRVSASAPSSSGEQLGRATAERALPPGERPSGGPCSHSCPDLRALPPPHTARGPLPRAPHTLAAAELRHKVVEEESGSGKIRVPPPPCAPLPHRPGVPPAPKPYQSTRLDVGYPPVGKRTTRAR